jgi:hypothetical protein
MKTFFNSSIVIVGLCILLGCNHTSKTSALNDLGNSQPKRSVAGDGTLFLGMTIALQSDVSLQSGRQSRFAKAFTIPNNPFSCIVSRPSFLKPELLQLKKDQQYVLNGIQGLISGPIGNNMHSVQVCSDNNYGDTTKPSCLAYGRGIEQNYVPGAVQYLISFRPLSNDDYGIDIQCNSLDMNKVLGSIFRLQ